MTIKDYAKQVEELSSYYFNNPTKDNSEFVNILKAINTLHNKSIK